MGWILEDAGPGGYRSGYRRKYARADRSAHRGASNLGMHTIVRLLAFQCGASAGLRSSHSYL